MGLTGRPAARTEAAAPAPPGTPAEFADEFVRYLAHNGLLPS